MRAGLPSDRVGDEPGVSSPFNPDAFAVDIRREGADAVVSLRGELDHQSAGGLASAVRQALGSFPAQLVLDLNEVTFVDSSGSALLQAVEVASDAGVPTQTLASLGGYARTLIDVTRMREKLGLR